MSFACPSTFEISFAEPARVASFEESPNVTLPATILAAAFWDAPPPSVSVVAWMVPLFCVRAPVISTSFLASPSLAVFVAASLCVNAPLIVTFLSSAALIVPSVWVTAPFMVRLSVEEIVPPLCVTLAASRYLTVRSLATSVVVSVLSIVTFCAVPLIAVMAFTFPTRFASAEPLLNATVVAVMPTPAASACVAPPPSVSVVAWTAPLFCVRSPVTSTALFAAPSLAVFVSASVCVNAPLIVTFWFAAAAIVPSVCVTAPSIVRSLPAALVAVPPFCSKTPVSFSAVMVPALCVTLDAVRFLTVRSFATAVVVCVLSIVTSCAVPLIAVMAFAFPASVASAVPLLNATAAAVIPTPAASACVAPPPSVSVVASIAPLFCVRSPVTSTALFAAPSLAVFVSASVCVNAPVTFTFWFAAAAIVPSVCVTAPSISRSLPVALVAVPPFCAKVPVIFSAVRVPPLCVTLAAVRFLTVRSFATAVVASVLPIVTSCAVP